MSELESAFGAPVIEAYGMTEAAHQIASNPRPPGVRKPGSVGRAVGCEVAVVDGQTWGGAAQGVGTAMYEESSYDANGQPLASTFADYILPGPTEIPRFRTFHIVTPSPYSEFGIKGMGEGGAIAPPAVICNAVNDALSGLGVEITETPLSPRRILAAIERAKSQNGGLVQ